MGKLPQIHGFTWNSIISNQIISLDIILVDIHSVLSEISGAAYSSILHWSFSFAVGFASRLILICFRPSRNCGRVFFALSWENPPLRKSVCKVVHTFGWDLSMYHKCTR
ncbi:hypothetical protein MLD38_021220 [Melastoma candidum]|uniref:Uncharacterized protein n=1 Tax=Melastoma candidum TaxID=119954 RepID=A0ACB9QGP1_9MYRT|nr:hypothetical protein MLD38_021220 [Melastoma candidum]